MAVPKVSVILNAMNGDPWIEECIQSVLSQSLNDFELIITDDGSQDGTWAKINSYKDPRIRAFKQENRGIAATANRGISFARAPYIARIDQDDVMMPARLQREFDYLEAHPDVALVCTYVQLIRDRKVSGEMYRAPLSSVALALRLVFECPIVQPSVMFRTDVFRKLGGYDEDKRIHGADDFELWTRMAKDYKLKCLPEALTHYRLHQKNYSGTMKSADHNILISERSLKRYLGESATQEECHALATIFHRGAQPVPPLSRSRALNMFNQVTDIIAGPHTGWDIETREVFNLQRRMIYFHHILRGQPFRLLIRPIPALRLR